jgi:ABC-2 type transport system permease protein
MDQTFMTRVWALIVKEIQVVLNDPESRKMLIIPVVLQIALFPFAATLEVKNNTLGVYNQDLGAESVELIQRLATAKAFSHLLILRNDQELDQAVSQQKALLVIRVPQDFSRLVVTGQNAPLQAILDGRRSNSGQIALGYVQQIITTWENDRLALQNAPPASIVTTRTWFNPNLEFTWSILPSLIAIILTVSTLTITALSMSREREQGTLDQLMVSPLTPEMIMLGKAIPAVIIAASQATVVLLAAVFFYRVPFVSSLFYFYFSILCYTASIVGFGFFIASFCATQQQSFLGTFCFLMPSILLSGFTAPVDNMPHWLQAINWFNPLVHFMAITKSIFLKEITLAYLANKLWPLLLIASLTLSAAIAIFRKRES